MEDQAELLKYFTERAFIDVATQEMIIIIPQGPNLSDIKVYPFPIQSIIEFMQNKELIETYSQLKVQGVELKDTPITEQEVQFQNIYRIFKLKEHDARQRIQK